MKPSVIVLALIALLCFLPACYTLNTVNSPTNSGVEISNVNKAAVSEHVVLTKWVSHFIFGLVTPDNVDVTRMLSDEAKARGAKGAVNVKVNYQMSFVNGLLTVVTFNIYNPFTLTVEADLVK